MEHPTDDDDRLETLEYLVHISRTDAGRARLAAEGTLASVLRRLSSSDAPLLLPRLRLVRNLCADEPANQDAFLASGGPDRVASVLLINPPVTADILRTVLQVLGNIATAGEEHKAAVWARFFPVWFREMARSRDPGVCNTLSIVLDSCCSDIGGRRRLSELCEVGRGLPILLYVVSTMSLVYHKEEHFYWLLGKACIEEIYFSLMFQGLSSPSILDSSIGVDFTYKLFTKEQVFLLETLSDYLSAWPGYLDAISKNFPLDVLQILEEASSVVDASSQSNSAVPNGCLATDVLEYSLAILRELCSWKNHSSPAAEDPADSLLSGGLLQLLLKFLRELELPNISKNQAMQASTDSKPCPYKGFRRDVVSVICNSLQGRKQVQDEIRNQDAIPLLLQQCIVDEYHPFLREWGTLLIRNLLEGNLENQYEVAELEQKEPVITPEISQMGLKVEIDQESQRPKIVNVSSGTKR